MIFLFPVMAFGESKLSLVVELALKRLCLGGKNTFSNIPIQGPFKEHVPLRWNEGKRVRGFPWNIYEGLNRAAFARDVMISESASPYLKDLQKFMKEKEIKLQIIEIKDLETGKFLHYGGATFNPSATKTLFLTEQALWAEDSLEIMIYKLLSEKYSKVPLLPLAISKDGRALALKMIETYDTKYVNELEHNGVSYTNENTIGLNQKSKADTNIHEITHTTTDRKLALGLNPVRSGRSMWIETKDKLADPRILNTGYGVFYRADEVEARVRQIAYLKFKKLPFDRLALELKNFASVQIQDFSSLLKKPRSEWVIDGDNLSHPELSVRLKIPVPKIRDSEKIKFFEEVIRKRQEMLQRYL